MKVLMLGWEFPPLINGGLGIACHGLSNALSRLVDLHVVLPKADLDAIYDNYQVSSLSHYISPPSHRAPSPAPYPVTTTSQSVTSHKTYSETFVDPPGVSPYFYDEAAPLSGGPRSHLEVQTHSEVHSHSQTHWEQAEGGDSPQGFAPNEPLFEIDELYGENVGQKVYDFSQALKRAALSYEFDLIHAHDWMTYQAGVELKKQTGKPLVLHLHASQYDRAGPEAKGWIYEIERAGMEAADIVIPVSNYTSEIVKDHYGIDPRKVRTVHNGAEKIESFKSAKKFPEKMVLFLGRLTAQKGPEFFLEIASLVLAENPNVRFVMAGTGEKMRSLIQTGAFKGLGGRFHFTGFLNKEKVQTLLSMTDVYCMPSVSEPFGLSALEAAQFGIPAVISKQSGVAELLKGALTADYWDTELMAQHINDLITDEALRQRVVSAAHHDIEAATWDRAAAKVHEIYESLLA